MDRPQLVIFSGSQSAYLNHLLKYLAKLSLRPTLIFIGSPSNRLYQKLTSLQSSLSHTGIKTTVDRILHSRSIETGITEVNSLVKDIDVVEFDYFTGAGLLESIQEIKGPKIGIAAGCGIIDQLLIYLFDGLIVNAHPALLPGLRGVDVVYHSLLLDLGLGISTHFVSARVDSGPIIEIETLPNSLFSHSFNEFMDSLVDFQAYLLASSVSKVISSHMAGEEVKTIENDPSRSRLVFQVTSSQRRQAIKKYHQKYAG